MKKYDVVVIGAGIAGAATAYFLKKNYGAHDILVLEKGPAPASGASGQNAGILRQVVETIPIAGLARRTMEFLSSPPDRFCETPVLDQKGGFLTVRDGRDRRLDDFLRISMSAGVRVYPVDRMEVLKSIPILDEARFVSALYSPTDGVIDINGLVRSFLRGIEVRISSEVTGFRCSDGKIEAVCAGGEEFAAGLFVIAAGAFSEGLGRLAGSDPPALEPRRRHLVFSSPVEGASPDWPYYWSMDPQLYFRYESSGLLLSPCDETCMKPESLAPSSEALSWLFDRIRMGAPKLVDIPVKRYWAELRTFAFDNNFLIGFDNKMKNLFWVTALQGHGMTCSSAVGEMAAALISGGIPPMDHRPHSPARFS
ncbi:MAG TPA: FAD-binding oxidoreductase [Acidobacteriota bacterium]|jgi:D-arginine dehydrogenase|nr:FAD-binding oxidoreductase [Acidobacteriota bacterium]HNT18119.1 FAD-binding oxidoreductase [Acidobacteriota bacterium]HPA27114.1 FAD-binding oxidoreductase [Acidobacteriota bacterium]HQO20770.1 FAD-binding oxidoreductase [Acidobacteriota bacterium]HQQ47556.1 FAD-binding oxidoreductase [Acidobacteriota bacterium]